MAKGEVVFKTIAIDGACRRNGKPDCVAAGGCFILDEDNSVERGTTLSQFEMCSTSQRGELMGLQLALDHAKVVSLAKNKPDILIVTDSEYLFNTMTKEWVSRWKANGWKTAQGDNVKNKDLWQEIWNTYTKISDPITFFHIKGHLLSIGAKKYHEIMHQDRSGYMLYMKACTDKEIKPEKLQHAQELSVANNGFMPEPEQFQKFAAMNLVADAVANLCIEVAEAKQWQAMLKNSV